MKIEQAHIDQIRKQFAELQSKEDLTKLLSDAKNMLYGEECKPVKLHSLTYYANPERCKKRYQTFTIKKKSGSDRTIHAPVKGLKSILRSLNFVLQCMYEPHRAATGFVLEKSIVNNAIKHVGQHYVLNMDLKDFFHAFDRNRVKLGFMYEPFNLNGDKEPLAFMLASLCTHPIEMEGEVRTVLPQGSPTSPTLTNILCKKLDRRLKGLAKRFGATYTRYADDITFSSPQNIYQRVDKPVMNERGAYEDFISELERLIKEEKLNINQKKTRLQKKGFRQEVTGLIVNDKVNVQRRYVKQIRMWIYYWEKYGYKKAEEIFKRDYLTDKGHVKNMKTGLVSVLIGKLEFLRMVKGVEDGTYKGLKGRVDKLIGYKEPINRLPEDNLNEKNPEQNRRIQDTTPLKYPIIQNPEKTVELLKYFTSNQKNLKYSTHSWEYGKFNSYDNFMESIKKEWGEFYKDLKEQNIRLHAKISNFLFNKDLGNKNNKGFYEAWGEKKLKFGWSSPELKEFMDSGEKKDPFNCPIPETVKRLEKEKNLFFFKDYVAVFKNEIEIREDSNVLKKMINSLWEEELSYDFKVSTDGIEGVSFYTDVALFSEAIKLIFRNFKSRPEFPNITIKVQNNQANSILISLTQGNSRCRRNIDDPKIISPNGGDLGTIIKNLNGLADFSISAMFPDDEGYKVNFLASNNLVKHIEEIPSIDGFTYELRFYL